MWSEQKAFVPCDHEYLNFKGGKFSKSRGAFVEVLYLSSKYDPDALRFYLTATAPETRDTEACPEGTVGDKPGGGAGPTEGANDVWPPEAAVAKQLPSGRWASALDESVVEEEYARLEG